MIVHNSYGKYSGEEAVVDAQSALLQNTGNQVLRFERSSAEIVRSSLSKARAFFTGIYNPRSAWMMRQQLRRFQPDIVHVHNVFPLISPSVIPVCRQLGIPVVMTVHNYRLVCPNGLHLPKSKLQICERCCGGREYWCLLRNCEGNALKSAGYALRAYVARKARFFLANVSVYSCLTDFQRRRLISEGYPYHRMALLPNMVEATERPCEDRPGDFVGFVGRISPEKGIDLLLRAAQRLAGVPVSLAGDSTAYPDLAKTSAPGVHFHGHLSRAEVARFYQGSRLIVLPSIWFEVFPLVLVEAMLYAKPVIAPHIGGLPEVVENGTTGLLFEPGNAEDLAGKIQYLWDRPELCRQMGQAGREKARREYSPGRYYERLMAVYEQAIRLGPPGRDQDACRAPEKSPKAPLCWAGEDGKDGIIPRGTEITSLGTASRECQRDGSLSAGVHAGAHRM